MRASTEKLLNALNGSMTVKKGAVVTNKKGVKYRYDEYRNKHAYTPNWLELLWYRAAEDGGNRHGDHFSDGDYSFSFRRARFKSEKNGPINYNKFVIIEENQDMTQKKKKKTVTVKPISGKKKKAAAKKKKPTGLNGLSATKTVRVSKSEGTKKDGTLKKGHRYVKGGGIIKKEKR